MKEFTCHDCGRTQTVNPSGGSGYGEYRDGTARRAVCYACCALRDRAAMDAADHYTLYLTCEAGRWSVSNWPGTLAYPARVRVGRHNIAGSRRDAWFRDHAGRPWHAVSYGDADLARCHRVKECASSPIPGGVIRPCDAESAPSAV